MLELRQLELPGCLELQPVVRPDARGLFVKTYSKELFEKHGLCCDIAEDYYSISNRNVLRGMHFQTPPTDHFKLVYCSRGEALDVILDLRKSSPTFGRYAELRLSGDQANMVYLPPGMAHGFLSLADNTTMHYKVSTGYSPAHDSGILWNSFGKDWGVADPIISERDQSFLPLSQFDTCFK
ncbi:dTDP-4-dehydrorhamnose 3,5-epimerase family protein [Pseudodesulfovibrio indicus]|uniref:dTDP-4-dehydrorhamnose 3,5-epimerase family protein n=1 Tax=Pseudodesulfovibrio indicus TaxID=1716143 RepID=UPI00292E0716|nr:dTDP-4-dehydrorhamnose 3,5-epimerase family protein [Pseudodesulfovibrio indicus]